MSAFFRLCPDDSHTCTQRKCLQNQVDGVCPLHKEEVATPAAGVKPKSGKSPTVSNPFNQWLVEEEQPE
jgi:hypothetical protein